jgi:putative ABC transport system substrate-binding protein
MNRPGGNVTGVSFYTGALGLKRLQLMRELAPQADTIAYLVNAATAAQDIEDIQEAARSIGQRISILRASTAQEIDAAFARAAEQHIGGIVVYADPFFANQHDQLVTLAAHYGIPSSYFNRAFAAAGGLMSYSDDRRESLRQASVYVGRILRGEKPGDLPVIQPTKFELVVNLKTAKSLGLAVPPTMLSIADEVIE